LSGGNFEGSSSRDVVGRKVSVDLSLERRVLLGRGLGSDDRVGPSFSNSERSRRRLSGRGSRSPRVVGGGGSGRRSYGFVLGGRGCGSVERDGRFGSCDGFDFGESFDGSGNRFGRCRDGFGCRDRCGRRRSRLGRRDGPASTQNEDPSA